MVGKRNTKETNTAISPSSFSQDILLLLQKHNISLADAQKELEKLSTTKTTPVEESFPLSIISEELTVLESLVTYLKEERAYTLHKIAEILGRNEKNLWHAYHSAKQKLKSKLAIDFSSPEVPLKIFTEQKLSPLETIVVYLKDRRELSYHSIAELLLRDDRTIWTTYMRAKKKNA